LLGKVFCPSFCDHLKLPPPDFDPWLFSVVIKLTMIQGVLQHGKTITFGAGRNARSFSKRQEKMLSYVLSHNKQDW
jgi:hypothetical protein